MRVFGEGRLDAVLAPAMFATAEPLQITVGREPWLVLAGASHRLAGSDGPVAAGELQAERLVVTGHGDAAAYDRAVAETLTGLGIRCELSRQGSGPALYAPVRSGAALALATSPTASACGLVARRLEPTRAIDFALFWRDPTPAPALGRFIGAAKSFTADGPEQRRGRELAGVA